MNKLSAILIAMLVVSAQCNWADQSPFCFAPQIFPVTLKTTPATIDVQRYMGTWYEIARMPAPFQKECRCSDAHYQFNAEGKFVNVHNTCLKTDGKLIEVIGKAYPQNAQNSKLNVYFNAIPGAYWILDIADDYSWAVVGEPCKKFGWLLSRTKTLPVQLVQSKVDVFRAKGYDVSKLVYRDSSC